MSGTSARRLAAPFRLLNSRLPCRADCEGRFSIFHHRPNGAGSDPDLPRCVPQWRPDGRVFRPIYRRRDHRVPIRRFAPEVWRDRADWREYGAMGAFALPIHVPIPTRFAAQSRDGWPSFFVSELPRDPDSVRSPFSLRGCFGFRLIAARACRRDFGGKVVEEEDQIPSSRFADRRGGKGGVGGSCASPTRGASLLAGGLLAKLAWGVGDPITRKAEVQANKSA